MDYLVRDEKRIKLEPIEPIEKRKLYSKESVKIKRIKTELFRNYKDEMTWFRIYGG